MELNYIYVVGFNSWGLLIDCVYFCRDDSLRVLATILIAFPNNKDVIAICSNMTNVILGLIFFLHDKISVRLGREADTYVLKYIKLFC